MLGFDAVGRYALGQIPTSNSFSILADVGVFALSGQDANVNVTYTLSATSFTLSGVSANINVTVTFDAGSFVLDGSQMAFISSFRRPLYLRGATYWRGT